MNNEEIDMSGLAVQTLEGALIARITVFENQELASEATGKACTSIADQLAVVRGLSTYVPDLSTVAGDKDARAKRALCVACRTGAKKVRLKALEPLKAIEKVLIKMEQDIEQEVRSVEEPLDSAIKIEEDRKEQEKIVKAQAEAIRVQKIQDLLSVFRGWPSAMIGATSAEIQDKIARCEKSVIKEETFQEFAKDAQASKTASIAQLQQLLASTLEQEQKSKELETARAEEAAKNARIKELEAMLAAQGVSSDPEEKSELNLTGEQAQVLATAVMRHQIVPASSEAEADALFDDDPGLLEDLLETEELASAVQDAMAYHDAIVEILTAGQDTQAMPNHMKFRAFVVAKCKEVLEG